MAASANRRPWLTRPHEVEAEEGSQAGEHTNLLDEVTEVPATNAQKRFTQPQEDVQVRPAASNVNEQHRVIKPSVPVRDIEANRPQPEHHVGAAEQGSVTSTTRSVSPSEHADSKAVPPKAQEKSAGQYTHKAIKRRLGWLVELIIVGGTLGILGIMAFWTFLWFGQDSNPTWHWIISKDHIKVIVSSTAEIVNRLVGFMLGAECSMLIALALERSEVLFPSLASASTGRSGTGAGKAFGLMKKVVTGKWPTRRWYGPLPYLVGFITILETLSLGTHTVLFADITLGQIATRGNSTNVEFGFIYQPQTISNSGGEADVLHRYSAWTRKSPFYPAFAEYSEPPVNGSGFSDTGVTLRAFLPYADSLNRQKVHSYTGNTTVLDARVTCQVPLFEDLHVDDQGGILLLSGFMRPTRATPRSGNQTLIYTPKNTTDITDWSPDAPVPFICYAPLANTSTYGLPDQWRSVLCQLPDNGRAGLGDGISGGLVSEFKNYSNWLKEAPGYKDGYDFGTAYLVFNISAGVWSIWNEFLWNQPGGATRIPVPAGSPVNEWRQFDLTPDLSFSATLCYSAFDTADIPVSITTTLARNTTEPEPKYNFGTRRYSFDDVRRQYGQAAHLSPAERGTLQLHAQSWIAGPSIQPPVEPYMRQYANLAGPSAGGNDPNWSGFLWDAQKSEETFNLTGYRDISTDPTASWITPDPMHGWLFQDVIAHGGSVAFALQSLITLLASMAYYDQLAQFDASSPVTQSFFIETNLPTRYWGYLAVTTVLGLHICVSWLVLVWFVTGTRYTMLGETWQALAQASTEQTSEWVAVAGDKRDDEVKALMGEELRKKRVRLRPRGDCGGDGDGMVGIYIDD